MKRNYLKGTLLLFLIIYSGCKRTNCDKVPDHFKSYQDAIETIKKYTYKLMDSLKTKDSANQELSAGFYSCDGKMGYLVYAPSPYNEYDQHIYENVPAELWDSLKNAKDKNLFHQKKIIGKGFEFKLVVEINLNEKSK